MYTNVRSCVGVNGTLSEEFVAMVGAHQGSVLSPYSSLWYLEHCVSSEHGVHRNNYMLMILC